jgi:hypothetical protein
MNRLGWISACLLAASPALAEDAVLVGKPAPKLAAVTWVSNFDEEPSLESLRGRPVLLVFWGMKCDLCMCRPVVRKCADVYAKNARQGLAVLGLQSHDVQAPELDVFALKYGVDFPMGNGGFNPEWGFTQVPRLYLLDPKGTVVWQGPDIGGDFPRKLAEAFRELDLCGEASLPAPLAPVKKWVQQRQFGKAIQKLIDFAADVKTPDDQKEAAKAFQQKLEGIADREIIRATSAIRMQNPSKGFQLLAQVAEEFKDTPKGREAAIKHKEYMADASLKPFLQVSELYRQFRDQVRKGNSSGASGVAQALFKKFPESPYAKATERILEAYDRVN